MANKKIKAPAECVLYLFAEGETELQYLKDFLRVFDSAKRIQLVVACKQSGPDVLLKSALQWLKQNATSKGQVLYWLLFDDDGRPDALNQFCKRYQTEYAYIQQVKLNFAYASPCIEVWALLHFIAGAKIGGTPEQVQRQLGEYMRTYTHKRYPYFDMDGALYKRECIQKAIVAAKVWSKSCEAFPQCVNRASHYAGIAFLIEQLLSIIDRQLN